MRLHYAMLLLYSLFHTCQEQKITPTINVQFIDFVLIILIVISIHLIAILIRINSKCLSK